MEKYQCEQDVSSEDNSDLHGRQSTWGCVTPPSWRSGSSRTDSKETAQDPKAPRPLVEDPNLMEEHTT